MVAYIININDARSNKCHTSCKRSFSVVGGTVVMFRRNLAVDFKMERNRKTTAKFKLQVAKKYVPFKRTIFYNMISSIIFGT